jgi:hypothetical protein
MKSYCRKALTASVLVLALSAPALAGEMQTGLTDPPPAASSVTQTVATDDATQTGAVAPASGVADTGAEAALNLALNLLSLI